MVLALLAAATGWLSREREESSDRPLAELDTRLNFALYDFHGRLLTEQGTVNMAIRAPVLRSNATSGVSTIENPELRIREEEERWYINAESAIITADREYVSLMGDVYVSRLDESSGEMVEVRTRDVMLAITPRTASSDSPVVITHENDRLEAVGLRLDMIANHFELLKDVRARYEPR